MLNTVTLLRTVFVQDQITLIAHSNKKENALDQALTGGIRLTHQRTSPIPLRPTRHRETRSTGQPRLHSICPCPPNSRWRKCFPHYYYYYYYRYTKNTDLTPQDSFNASMHPTKDMPGESTCTSCQFAEDFSNYWTAILYFRAQNGTYKRVKNVGNNQFRDANGGLTVYYMQDAIYDPTQKSKVTAFKPVSRFQPPRALSMRFDTQIGFPHVHR
jgi:hypothetical protein